MRPGAIILALHGKMKQMKRMAQYVSFCENEGGVMLFATDLAARGLDFAGVDWVVQVRFRFLRSKPQCINSNKLLIMVKIG